MSTSNNNTPPPSFLRRSSPFVRKPRTPSRASGGARGNGSPLISNRRPVGGPSSLRYRKDQPNSVAVKKEEENEGVFQEFKITACTREEIENVQYHLMKFQSRNEVNPVKDFTKPIRLHRKDPRNMQFQLTLKEIDEREQLNRELRGETADDLGDGNNNDNGMGAALDLDALEAKEVEEEAQTVAPEPKAGPTNIAPEKQKGKNKRKTREVRVMNEDARKLRYEEFYPWVMEDYDGSNTFVGNYEAATTVGHNHALLVPVADGSFKMIPINKIYKFTPRNKYATLTLEEAEQRLQESNSVPRWVMEKIDDEEEDGVKTGNTKKKNARRNRFKTVSTDDLFGDDDDDERKRNSDNDGMDYDEEFADDEEAPIVGDHNDEEEKESRKRMEKEMLSANTGLEQTVDDDVNDLFDEEAKKKFDKEGKKLKKTLVKNEYGQIMYESEDEENPYMSDSDLETSESETEVKKEETNGLEGLNDSNKASKSTSPMPPHAPQISVKLPINNPIGFVTFTASKALLSQFPGGDWNPAVSKKRSIESAGEKEKSHKRQKTKAASPGAAAATGAISSPGSPGSPGYSSDANDPTLLTQEEIVNLISTRELTAKELFVELKPKIAKNKANKEIFKTLIKKSAKVKINDKGIKVLVLKNTN
ncbi:transcription factor IIF subunit [Saccharomycopsis crataegensis]|uniref:Transcription initiation factor IIF subunit alpha n=1 Tax=Saccharomycopsis crataegensis TaxID=43959 RepID=A0AAV5QEN2_9ASCO|nr:transcription factor IIF subunit [Saccharomycopsis crataegensis]